MKKLFSSFLIVMLISSGISVPSYAMENLATLISEDGEVIEIPVEVEKMTVDPSSINYNDFFVDNKKVEEFSVNVPGDVLAKALGYDHAASDSVVQSSVKLWGKVYYDKAAGNGYLLKRMEAATRVIEPSRVYIDREDIHIACTDNQWSGRNILHFENLDGRYFDKYPNFTEFVYPDLDTQALVGASIVVYVKHHHTGKSARVILPIVVAGSMSPIWMPSGGK